MARSSIESPTRNTRRNAIIVSKSNSGSFYNFDSVSLQHIPNWSISMHSESSNKDSPRRNQRSIEKLFRRASNSFGRREIKRAYKIFETRSSRDLQLTYIRSRLHIDPRNTCIWRFSFFFFLFFYLQFHEVTKRLGLKQACIARFYRREPLFPVGEPRIRRPETSVAVQCAP